MGRLDRLELENFKSYGGHVVVGPFKGFTSIIGPNGSGKSNLMDAISFVLGVRASQLRGNQLRDLIYRDSEKPNEDISKRKCYVKLVYQTDEDVEIEFMRGVTSGGSSEYRVDGQSMTLENYNKRLADIGILVKARNFLVFQNEVENIASRTPKQLTALFEEISGSGELKVEYEEARKEKEAAEEEVMTIWRKRKGMAAERKQYKEQKEEAEKYRKLEADLAAAKTQHALYQLYHIDSEVKVLSQESEDLEEQMESLETERDAKKAEVTKARKEGRETDKGLSTEERKLKRLEDELEKMQPLEVRYESEKKAAIRRIKADERTLTKLDGEVNAQSEEIALSEQELEAVIQKIEETKAQIAKAEEPTIAADVLAEYNNLKEVARTKTSVVQQEVDVAERVAADAQRHKEALISQVQSKESRIGGALAELDAIKRRVTALRREKAEISSNLQARKEDQVRSREVWNEQNQVRQDLEQIVNETTERLRNAKADRNESSRVQKFNEAYDSMKRLFPGVHGRLSDLCRPTQNKYREAVAVIFGKMMDAIVVDNERTATECISYLKEQRAGIASFLPLADLRPKTIDESLRRLGGTARLAIDVVTHDQRFTPAVHYAAGSAVVCDTLSEARSHHYGGRRKIKICSVDGTLISKVGFMTGGSSGQGNRAKKWDRAETDSLKKKRASAQNKLLEMGSLAEQRTAESRLVEQIDSLSRRLSMMDAEISSCEKSAVELSKDEAKLSSELETLKSRVERASADFSSAEEKAKSLKGTLDTLEASTFGDFPERHGTSSVSDFESQFIKRSTPLRKKLLTLQTHQSTLNSELKYARTKVKSSPARRVRKKIDTSKEKLSSAEAQLESLISKRAELENRLSSVQKRTADLRATRSDRYETVKSLESELEAATDALSKHKTDIEAKKGRLKSLWDKRRTLLLDCEVEQILIPVITDDAEQDEGTDVGEDKGSNSPNIDYGELKRAYRKRQSEAKQSSTENELRDRIKSLSMSLESLAPNLRAQDQMKDVQKRLADVQKEADDAREVAREASEKFEELKITRQDLFNTCFNHVANGINEVYRQLTRSTNYPMGGNAYLSLDQQDEPYNGGVKFNAMPPTKRFRDMEQLSGGERTVAALALLFAVHDFRPSPFFVLDEVDAALDNLNVGKVSAYVRNRAPELQTIVISLKDAFYEKADGLVGIYRDSDVNASRLLTLDLSSFPDANQGQQQPVA